MLSRRAGKAHRLVIVGAAILLSHLPLAAVGQTYRDRLPPPARQRVDGLPEQLATRPTTDLADRQQGRGEEQPAARSIDSLAASSGQGLVAEAARRAFALPSLQARLRMKLNLQGRQLTAAGQYIQVGGDAEKLLRLDLKVPVGSKIGTVQEIRGRDYLWIIKDLPPDDPKLERVILRNARIQIRKADEAKRMTPLEGWMLLGGLSRLLDSVNQNFEFGLPRQALLGDVPVLIVRGKWKPQSLAVLSGGKPLTDLPAQLPHEVELTLGGPGELLPLFPYRIEYLRRDVAAGEGRGGTLQDRSMALIEFYEVRQPSQVDPSQFEFDPEEREFDDVTMAYLRKLGLMPGK